MTEDYKGELQKLLRTLFQFDSADLDFGIYRIMNQKRTEIERFIDEDLITTVDTEFERYSTANKKGIEKSLKEIKNKIKETLGEDVIETSGEIREEYKNLPVAKEYNKKREELKNAEVSNQQKAEIFSHIYQFFSRYYHDGDFLSLRRYSRENKYAIPYNGEEVILHWANKDQYYIKTGEYFKNYSFTVGDYKVSFRLSNAETDKNNNKSEKRFFVLKEGEENIDFDENNKELTILFEYRGLNNDEKTKYGTKKVQENIIDAAKDVILNHIRDLGVKNALDRNEDGGKSILEKHLIKYTKRNTTDYFIHKNLKRFLEQELDFYIKNEVLMLDDLCSENEPNIEQYITRVKVIKAISKKIIDFLAQIEDFQKKLWEKKKFVIKTNYCMTLDKVPEAFYEEIIHNEAQINEWKELFKLEEVEKGTLNYTTNGGLKIDTDYLKTHPFLVLDTKFFDQDFKDRLLATFEDLDAEICGLMIKSENWQALNLLMERYRERVKCIYIDPPYNTGNDEFIYKDNYQHSSWLSMMGDRLTLTRELMEKEGVIFVSVDDGEQARLKMTMDTILKSENFVANIIWQKKFSPQNDAKWLSDNHDFIIEYAKNKESWKPNLLPRTEKQNARYTNPDNDPRGPWASGGLDVKTYMPEYDYEITTPAGRIVKPPKDSCWRVSKEKLQELMADNRIWFGEDGNNVPRIKRFLSEVKQGITPLTVWLHQEVGHNQEATQELKNIGVAKFTSPKPKRLIKRILQISTEKNPLFSTSSPAQAPLPMPYSISTTKMAVTAGTSS